MDTNLVAVLIQALAAKQQPEPSDDGRMTVLVVGMCIAAIAPTLAAIAAFYNSRAARLGTEEARKTAVETSETIEKVHVAVNSERTAMIKKLEELTAEILRLSKINTRADVEREKS